MAAYRHALSQMAVGSYQPAMVIFEDLIGEEMLHFEISPDELKLNLAVCYRETQRFDESVTVIEELLLQLSSGDSGRKEKVYLAVNARLECGTTYERMGRYFEAMRSVLNAKEYYDKHLHRDPYLEGKVLLYLADLYKRLHRLEEAQATYEQAMRVYEPLSDDLTQIGPIYHRLAEVYFDQQNLDMAIEYANKAIMTLQAAGLVVDYREAKRVLVKQQVNAENWQDSVSVLLNLASIQAPNFMQKQAEIYLDVAEISFRFDDVEESLNRCLMTLSLLSKHEDYSETELVGRANLIMGGVFEQKGDDLRAIQCLENAVRIFKIHENIHEYNLAVRQLCTLLRRIGERDKAFELYDEAHNFIIERLNMRGVAL
jgi:tetratricopeptide (TPR) repeat protein